MTKNKNKQAVSKETQDEALKIAKMTQQSGQSKAQTRLIAKGIEKGIAEYKKQQKAKSRKADKWRKKEAKAKQTTSDTHDDCDTHDASEQLKPPVGWLALAVSGWLFLLLSWAYFFLLL